MSEETRTASMFELAYASTPPWEIGRPQHALTALADAGDIHGSVLDVGCGTGELALDLARRGHAAWGIDASPTAIARAREKARARGVDASFRVADALALEALERTFDTAVDCGVFHVFSDADRLRYAKSLACALPRGGAYYTLVFSDREPVEWGGPRPVHAHDFARTFADGWRVRWVREARFETTIPAHARRGGAFAWLAAIDRV